MNKYLVFSLIYLTIMLCSCVNSSKGSSSNIEEQQKVKKDTLYNDSIQGVFFGTPFGASKEEVVKNLEGHGFVLNRYESSDVLLDFFPTQGSRFSFGNISWKMLDVLLSNNKFYYIRFINTNNDKASALSQFDEVFHAVSAKYYLNDYASGDTTIYKMSVGYTKMQRGVFVICRRYESTAGNIIYGTMLEYLDNNYYKEVSDEL